MFRLQDILDDRDMMQKELAEALALPKQTMSNYASGKRQADYETLVAICDVLGITMDYLFGRSSSPTPAVSDEDAALLQAYHAAPEPIRRIVDAALQDYKQNPKDETAAS